MTIVSNYNIVFNYSSSVDDAIFSYFYGLVNYSFIIIVPGPMIESSETCEVGDLILEN